VNPGVPSSRAYALGTIAVVAAASSWGLWSLFVRPAALPAMTFALVVFLVMGVVTLPAVAMEPAPLWSRRAYFLLVMNGLWDAANVLTFFAAMQETTVAVAVLTHYLAPVLVAVLAPYVDREHVRGAIPGAIIACVGLALVLEPWHGRVNLVARVSARRARSRTPATSSPCAAWPRSSARRASSRTTRSSRRWWWRRSRSTRASCPARARSPGPWAARASSAPPPA